MPNNEKPQDLTTGDVYITEKNLAEILQKLNQNLGDETLKDIIEQQKEALEQLNKEFSEQLQEKNDIIADLEKQLNDLLLNQPVDPNNPTIGNTLVELKKQIDTLRQELTQHSQETDLEHAEIIKDLEANTQNDTTQTQEIEALKQRLDNLENGLSPDFVLDEILKDPIKAQEIIKEILKNPHNFPPFNLNPLVDANSDIFAQVRETLNTARELLRLLSTLDYINNDFQTDVSKFKEELEQALNDILNKRDETLKQFETIIQALEQEIKDMRIVLDSMQKESDAYKLLRDEMKWYYDEVYAYYVLCDDYATFCHNIKNDCITLRDDMKAIQIDIESIKEETRNYRDQVEFWHTSLVNMGYDKLVAKVNQLEAMINAMAEQKRQEVLEAINALGERLKQELKELFLDYKAILQGNFAKYTNDLDTLSKEIIELIDDKKLESLDQINIATLSSLASLQSAKQIAVDLIKYTTDEGIEELTQHKSDYIVELQDIKVDAINSINENFASSGKGFLAELARINNEIALLKQGVFAANVNYITEHITATQEWTTPNDNTIRNYFILLQGSSGYDNSNASGGVVSFGSYRSVNGGLGNAQGRGNSGESAFLVLSLEPNTTIPITIGEGRTKGFVSITYADSTQP